MLKKADNVVIYSLVFAAISLACACEHFSKKPEGDKGARLLDLKYKFKYRNLKVFETDTFNFDNRPGHYNEVDSNSFNLIFSQEDRSFIGQGYDRDYFYAWQERDPRFIEFVMLTQEENSYCDMLRYYIFDKQGRFINSFDIAASCGDAEWTYTGSGKQLTQSAFFYETVESDQKEGTSFNTGQLEGDTITYLITVGSTGHITKKETSRKHFTNN